MHGRGIGIKELTSEEIKLKIINFADNKELNTEVRMYYDVLKDYITKTAVHSVLHGTIGLNRLI